MIFICIVISIPPITNIKSIQDPVQDPDNRLHQLGGVHCTINVTHKDYAPCLVVCGHPSYYASVHGRVLFPICHHLNGNDYTHRLRVIEV